MFSNSTKEIEKDDDVSKYTKYLVNAYISNIKYKLESLVLDKESLTEYVKNYNEFVNDMMDNDDHLIEKYSDLRNIIPILEENGIKFNYDLLKDKTDLEIFNIVYDMSNKYDIIFD